MTKVVHKDVFSDTSALVSPFTHILSDESVDGYDDIIRQDGWDFSTHDANPVVLLAHNTQEPPVGRLTRREVRNKKLYGHIEMAPRGTTQRIDELRALMGIDGGGPNILRAVSVGFFPIESRPRAGSTKGGVEYLRQRLCEVSLCSVPANSSALAIARSLKISRSTMVRVFNDGSLVSEHIAKARKAVAQEHKYSATVANIERKIERLWRRIRAAATEAEQDALFRQVRVLERAAIALTPERLQTADQKAVARAEALRAEQARNDPWGFAARKRESDANSLRLSQKAEREYMAYLIANPTVHPEIPRPGATRTTGSGNIITWRGVRIDMTPTWKGKKII